MLPLPATISARCALGPRSSRAHASISRYNICSVHTGTALVPSACFHFPLQYLLGGHWDRARPERMLSLPDSEITTDDHICVRNKRLPVEHVYSFTIPVMEACSRRARSQFSSVSPLRKHALGTSALPVLFCFSLTQPHARDARAPTSLLCLSHANMRSRRARSQFASVSPLRKHALGTSALPVLFCFSFTQACARDERAPSSLLFLPYASMRSGRARSQ